MLAPLPEPRLPSAGRGPELVDPETLVRLHREVAGLLDPGAACDPHLSRAVAETLENPGSLWRAQLAWSVGRALGLDDGAAMALAGGVEAFHTASLLLDDLPAMDDARERRGRPCVHLAHGEGAALLAALAFVHRGYSRVWSALHGAPLAARRAAEQLVEECLGLEGILDGQARDLHFGGGPARIEAVAHVAADKTVPLLRLALVLPAVVAGAGEQERRELDRLAAAWGLGYQLLDDLSDLGNGDAGNAGETDAARGRANFAGALGRRAALERLDAELERAQRVASRLSARRPLLGEAFARLVGLFGRQRQALGVAPSEPG